MARMGRPPKEIKKEQFEALCEMQCTYEEVCSVLDVTEKTLQKWCKATYGTTFSHVFKEKRMRGRASLRRNNWLLAKNNVAMAIFLAKNFLGMRDNPVVEAEERADDGFLKALAGTAAEDWSDEAENDSV